MIGEGAAHAVEESEKYENAHEETACRRAAFRDHVDALEKEENKTSDTGEARITGESKGDTGEKGGVEERGSVDREICDFRASQSEKREKGGYAGDEDGAPHGDPASFLCFFHIADIWPKPR